MLKMLRTKERSSTRASTRWFKILVHRKFVIISGCFTLTDFPILFEA